MLDRQITGQDWLRQPIASQTDIQRITVFGIKGGVGRSTALAVWAWYLAQQGKRVLVLDLDLESPGIGQTLLPDSNSPDLGIIDWLVEDAVDQADESLLRELVGTSPLVESSIGDIRIVPASGTQEKDYIAKLSRAYMESSGNDFAERLSRLLHALEKQEKPDIVLLDSRAGIHDIAAITITRLNAYALLFAINTPQTWGGYRLLFQHWQRWHPNLAQFRNNFKIVAGMVPEIDRANYLESCRQSAYDLFVETLYEETLNEDEEGFNFDEKAIDAPHYPLKFYWHRAFQEFAPVSNSEVFNENSVLEAYGTFLKEITSLTLPE
ncbi:MAG: P-loop NTPase [Pseudomonadota bacterium]